MYTLDENFDSSVAGLEDASDTTQKALRKKLGLNNGVVGSQGQAGHLEAQQRQGREQRIFLLNLANQMNIVTYNEPSEGQIETGRRLSEGAADLERNGVLARIGFSPDHATLENDEAA